MIELLLLGAGASAAAAFARARKPSAQHLANQQRYEEMLRFQQARAALHEQVINVRREMGQH